MIRVWASFISICFYSGCFKYMSSFWHTFNTSVSVTDSVTKTAASLLLFSQLWYCIWFWFDENEIIIIQPIFYTSEPEPFWQSKACWAETEGLKLLKWPLDVGFDERTILDRARCAGVCSILKWGYDRFFSSSKPAADLSWRPASPACSSTETDANDHTCYLLPVAACQGKQGRPCLIS